MAEKKKMSVAEILAAARKTDGGGTDGGSTDVGSTGGEEPPSIESAPVESASADAVEAGSPAPVAAGKPQPAKSASGGRPSVAEMMAMARAEKSGGERAGGDQAIAANKPTSTAAAKPAANQPAAGKPFAGKTAAAKAAPAEPRDTASILAAARKSSKAGPMSKAEAAAKAQADPTAASTSRAKPQLVVPPMPAKPAYAQLAGQPTGASKQTKGAAEPKRRDFLWVGFSALAAVTGLWTFASLKFMFPNVRREPPSKFKVGFPDAYPAGQVETKFKAQYGIWVANAEYAGQQQIYALKSVCTHLGCTPSWLDAEQKYKCPCHGSGFYKDGINFEGPAPRPLERCAIRIADDGQIEVDKSRIFQEEMGQWEDPSCYIPV